MEETSVASIAHQESPHAVAYRAVDLGGLNALGELEERWDDLVRRSADPSPFLRAGWLRDWWAAFGRGEPHLVAVFAPDGSLVGGALFASALERFEHVPVRTLSLAANVHSNRADLLAAEGYVAPVAAAMAAWAHDRRARWSVLRLDEVPEDSVTVRAFLAELERLGHPIGSQAASQSPFVDLGNGYEAFETTLKSKWKSNLRNREKRLADLGRVVHETVWCALPDLDARLEECFRLEAMAWKAKAGSAIVSSKATSDFYRNLAHRAAAEGSLALQTLRVSGRLAAFQLDLVQDGVEYVLKIGYEPELKAYSPGALLLKRVIAATAGRSERRVDLLGDDMPWKRDWTTRVRSHRRFFAFGRGPVGRSLFALEFVAFRAARLLRDRMEARRS